MNKKVTFFFLEKKVSFLIITSWVAGAWFVPNVNNEGADQPRVLVQFYQLLFVARAWFVPTVNNKGADQP